MNINDYKRVRDQLNKTAGQSLTIEEFAAMDAKQKKSTLRKLVQITGLKESNLRDFGMIKKSYALTKLKQNRRIKSVEDIAKLTPNQMTREANIILNFLAAESSTPYGIISREKSIDVLTDSEHKLQYSDLSNRDQKRFWNLADKMRDMGITSRIYGSIGSDLEVKLLFEFFTSAVNDGTVRNWDEYAADDLENIMREKMNLPMTVEQQELRMARNQGDKRDSALRALGFTGHTTKGPQTNSKRRKKGGKRTIGTW